MRFVPVPGFGMPGRDVPFLDHDGNIVTWFDRQIFSAKHLYEGTRDPEGLISTIPALGTTLIGVLTGLFLRSQKLSDSRKALGLAAAGVTGVILGFVWNPWFPLNKKLWTSSFVLYAAGWSLLILAAFWFLVQVRNYRRGTWPLLVFGTNAISAYVISEVMADCLSTLGSAPTATCCAGRPGTSPRSCLPIRHSARWCIPCFTCWCAGLSCCRSTARRFLSRFETATGGTRLSLPAAKVAVSISLHSAILAPRPLARGPRAGDVASPPLLKRVRALLPAGSPGCPVGCQVRPAPFAPLFPLPQCTRRPAF